MKCNNVRDQPYPDFSDLKDHEKTCNFSRFFLCNCDLEIPYFYLGPNSLHKNICFSMPEIFK